jgi:hypothetical protein
VGAVRRERTLEPAAWAASHHNEARGDEPDTLAAYLEEAVGMRHPDVGDTGQAGLIGGTLVWLSSIDPGTEHGWQPLTRSAQPRPDRLTS